jgi:hypothetical protein
VLLLASLSQDYENVEDVNRQLERMGYNIGVRIIEDFLARTGSGKCTDFRCCTSLCTALHCIATQGDLGEGAAGIQDLPWRLPDRDELVSGGLTSPCIQPHSIL